MVSEASVATAALAIAISALVIAAGQLVAQLFSTADGYRRCQRSIIGDWYKLVELRFRWSSFRYEVKVTTPHFGIATMRECQHRISFYLNEEKPLPRYPALWRQSKSRYLISPSRPAALMGIWESRKGTLCRVRLLEIDSINDDAPTWVDLLDAVHRVQGDYSEVKVGPKLYPEDLAPICISRRTRSWDFMPPDIVRPVASTTIGCLITMAYRLGMHWTDFRLDEGIMRAVGGGRTLSTSIVRGMGLVVEYNAGALNQFDLSRVPSKVVDQLTFGIISSIGTTYPSNHRPGYPELYVRKNRAPEEVNLDSLLRILRISSGGANALEASLSHHDPAHRLPAFTDILGLWCKWLPIEGTTSSVIDNPFPFPLTTMGERPESRNVWRLELNSRKTPLSEPCKQVLSFFNTWEEMSTQSFMTVSRKFMMDPSWSAHFRKAFNATTKYLNDTDGVSLVNMYSSYIACHIDFNASSLQRAEENIKNGRGKTRHFDPLPKGWDPIFLERAYIYAENVPKFAEEMERRNPTDGRVSYEDVWWMMMMRLHAWTMSVEWVDREGVKIPSEHYYNPARVYIL